MSDDFAVAGGQSLNNLANELIDVLASHRCQAKSAGAQSLHDLYIAKKQELAKTYFDSEFRARLLNELQSSS